MNSFLKKKFKHLVFNLSTTLYRKLGFSQDFYFFLDQFLKSSNEPLTIFEIGAHFGIDTLKLSCLFPNSQIYAFEPDPRNFQILSKLDKSPNIHIFNQAISDSVGYSKFFMSMSHKPNFSKFAKYPWIDKNFFNTNYLSRSGASSLLTGHEALDSARDVTVSTTTLDNFCLTRFIQAIDLLWIDVQGAENLVIKGANDTLSTVKYIWIEYGFTQYE